MRGLRTPAMMGAMPWPRTVSRPAMVRAASGGDVVAAGSAGLGRPGVSSGSFADHRRQADAVVHGGGRRRKDIDPAQGSRCSRDRIEALSSDDLAVMYETGTVFAPRRRCRSMRTRRRTVRRSVAGLIGDIARPT